MPIFKYKALDQKNHIIRGKVSAVNTSDLREKLSSMGYRLLKADVHKEMALRIGKGFKKMDIINVFLHLEKVLRLDIPLLEGLSSVVDSITSNKLKTVINEIRSSVAGGKMLYEALAEHPKVFDKATVEIIEAGEKSGSIVDILDHLTQYMQWQIDVKKRLLGAMYYPMALLFMSMGALMFMFVKVLPKMIEFLKEQDMQIPFYTKALIATANFLSHKWYYIFFFIIFFILLKALLSKFVSSFNTTWDRVKLKLPVFGAISLKLDIAYFAYLFSISLKSNIGIINACDVGRSVVHNSVIREVILNIKKSVANGNDLSTAFEISGIFPSMVVKLAKIGQSSDSLPEMMEKVAMFYDREAKDGINALAATIKPAMILFVGGLLIWIVLGTFGPMYQNVGHMIENYQ